MKNNAQKTHASTQKFTEIVDIVDDIVLLVGGSACIVIEITASNFALLSKKEQDAKIYAYASLLNSLNFPIQILIRNKRMDITSYLKELEEEERATKNELLAKHISLYRDFVREMVKVNVVLNKAFYVVIPFSALEAGLGGVKTQVAKNAAEKDALVTAAQKSLYNKATSVHQQLAKLAIAAKMFKHCKVFMNSSTINREYTLLANPRLNQNSAQFECTILVHEVGHLRGFYSSRPYIRDGDRDHHHSPDKTNIMYGGGTSSVIQSAHSGAPRCMSELR